jgi:hypothetical protein
MDVTVRLFNCVRCHQLVFVCSCCDRGQIYCSSLCALVARQKTIQLASAHYQRTRSGKRNHARRQAEYLLRLQSRAKKMTHQGIPKIDPSVSAPPDHQPQASPLQAQAEEERREQEQENQNTPTQQATDNTAGPAHREPATELVRCSFCHRLCQAFIRRGFRRPVRVPIARKRCPRPPVLRRSPPGASRR